MPDAAGGPHGVAAMAWLAANGLALVLLAVVVGQWSRAQPRARRSAAAAALGIPLAVALLAVFLPEPPIGWITAMQEGRSLRNVQQLYGLCLHYGAGFYMLTEWLTGHGITTLPTMVRLNIVLAAVNALLFACIASYVLRSWLAGVVFTLGYAWNLNTVHAAASETPAMLCATHFWLGCVAAAVVGDRQAAPWLRRTALLCLGLLVVLAGLLRTELLALGVPALAVGVAHAFGQEARVQRAVRAAGRLVGAILGAPLSIFLAVSLALVGLEFVPWRGESRQLIAGLRPMNLSFLMLPRALEVFLPLALIALFVCGLIHAVRRWFDFLLLPFTTLALFKVYMSAAHGAFFEQFRYLMFLLPAVLFLSLFGFRELQDWARRWAWPFWWKRLAVLLLVLSCILWQPAGPRESFGRRQRLPGIASPEALLGWNQQSEVRYLLDLVARYPTCVFLVKALEAEAAMDGPPGHRWVAFGGAVPRYREMPAAGGTLEEAAAQLAPGAACVLFYRSLDCDLVGLDDCRAETADRVALEERVLENLPYSDIAEYGAHRAELHLGVYPVAPPPQP